MVAARPKPGGLDGRKGSVSKTVLAIVGIGIGGCLLLSLMMKQLVQHQVARQEAPLVPGLMKIFGKQLAGPLATREEFEGASLRLVVHGRVAPQQDKQALAAAIGNEVWQRLAETPPTEVCVTLRDADGTAPLSQVVARPSPPR